MTLPSLAPGALFGAHSIVGRVLGKNELSVVYEAEDAHKARFAALKLFEAALSRDTAAWQRFETLTRSLAELPGEGIARSYDVGVLAGRPFVASECSVFPTLSRYVSERGPLVPRAFRDSLMTLASALEASHRAGIVHGNLKPQNVFVSVNNPGWARLTDFGVAELREAAGVAQPRTLGWNAPEVTPAPPTAASDLFALGLLTFFALSGSPWYSAQRSSAAGSAERARTASERARAYGGDIPTGLDAWFERALAREPRDRFSTAGDMAQAFARALEDARSSPPSFVGALSATVPVPQKGPFAHSNPEPQKAQQPPGSKLDPNGPTAPQVAVTEQLPARQAAAVPASLPPPHPVPAKSSAPPPQKSPRTVSVLFFGLGAFFISALVLGVLTWFLGIVR